MSEEKLESTSTIEIEEGENKEATKLASKKNKRNLWIISGIFLGLVALVASVVTIGFLATQIAGNSSSKTYLNWYTNQAGFYDINGKLIVGEDGNPSGEFNYSEWVDEASSSYGKITSIKEPANASSLILPSSINNLSTCYVASVEEGDNIFGGTSSILAINSKSLYREIGDYAFSNMSNLESVGLTSEETGSQVIGAYAFANNPRLKTINFAHNLISLGKGALRNNTLLTATNLGKTNLKTIEDNAFEGCSSLATLSLPETLSKIGAYAFKGSNITTLEFAGSMSLFRTVNKDNNWNTGSLISKINCLDGTIGI